MKALFLILFLTANLLHAQQHLTAPRPDGKSTPLMLYKPSPSASSCAPLAVISHGAGGSENGYRYLAQSMALLGFTTVVMGHAESGLPALTADMRAHGIRSGIQALVTDPEAERDRLIDIAAALKWADTQCHAPFRVLLGHSMGAETVMLEAGAVNTLGIPSPPAAQNRFDAYIALSPEGPGVVFADKAWSGIRKPILILTGTRDQALNGGPETRQIPFRELPGTSSRCQWQAVIDNATHMNFAGTGLGSETVKPKVTQTIASFLTGVRTGTCTQPAAISGVTLHEK